MSERLKHLTKIASVYLADAKWPPANLVEQIGAEASRIGIEPPIEYRVIQSPEDKVGFDCSYFTEEPEIFLAREYLVRSPYHEVFSGIVTWDIKTPGSQFTPNSNLVEVIQVKRVAQYPPSKHVLRAIQAWIPYLEAQEQSPSAGKPKVKRGKRAGESDNDTKIVAALTKYHDYGNGRCLNYEPIMRAKLAKLAGVPKCAVTRFFQKHFPAGRYEEYKTLCRSREDLDRKLQILNREDPKERLYGSDPDQRHYSD